MKYNGYTTNIFPKAYLVSHTFHTVATHQSYAIKCDTTIKKQQSLVFLKKKMYFCHKNSISNLKHHYFAK